MKNLILEMGAYTKVVVDVEKITPNDMIKMSKSLLEVRKKNSIFAKYPILDDETSEQWQERVKNDPDFAKEEGGKKEDETSEAFIERLWGTKFEKVDVLFDTLQGLAGVFNQGEKVTREAYDTTPYFKAKNFVVELLKTCDFPTDEY